MSLAGEVNRGEAPQAEAARSLPAWIYANPEFLALERERIFARSWQPVCHASDIPVAGDYRTLELLGDNVVVIRGADGGVRAFHNVCRHRAARLLDGHAGRCPARIVCPYHAWAYAHTGDLVWVPYEAEYEGLEKSRYGLASVECEVRFGFVFVRLSPGGVGIDAQLEPAAADLAHYRLECVVPLAGFNAREVPVNWKNGTDNYVDALHVRVAHPGLNSLLNRTYTLEDLGGGVQRLHGRVEEIAGDSAAARRYDEILPDVAHLPASHKRMWLYFMIWPNFAFNLYPDQVEYMHFVPISATHTRIRFASYALPDERPLMREARDLNMRLNVDVGTEDTDLITRVQAGMASRSFGQGPLGLNEVCLRAFAARLRRELPVCLEPGAPPPGRVAERNAELGSGAR